MSRYLLDADSIIDFLYAIGGTVQLLQGLYDQGDTLCSCDVVLAEVYAGLHAHERARAEAFLSSVVFLPTSAASACQAGTWRYAYKRQGQTLSTTDCLIAAVAVEHEATLVTGNIKDFPMPEVTTLPLPRVR